ncbi:hypothetical protein G9A89_010762 [Geosiphon pyriformis]|nr:hypothetical protein G9A89_010762 [Geosiphon pyriformis]
MPEPSSQILNQFIRGLHSSILQCIRVLHLADFQAAVTNARDFEAAELKANYAQAINLVINRLSDLDSNLLVTPEDVSFNNVETNQAQPLTSNIFPATITNDELLTAIFPFKLEKLTSMLLFSEATLKKKPITAMYTNTKVDDHSIKLILDSRLAGSIIT